MLQLPGFVIIFIVHLPRLRMGTGLELTKLDICNYIWLSTRAPPTSAHLVLPHQSRVPFELRIVPFTEKSVSPKFYSKEDFLFVYLFFCLALKLAINLPFLSRSCFILEVFSIIFSSEMTVLPSEVQTGWGWSRSRCCCKDLPSVRQCYWKQTAWYDIERQIISMHLPWEGDLRCLVIFTPGGGRNQMLFSQ